MAPFLLQKYTHRRDRTKRSVCDFTPLTSAYPLTTASRPCSPCVTVCERFSLPSSYAAGNKEKETYEAIEAIDTKDTDLLREELGDVLLQVALYFITQ